MTLAPHVIEEPEDDGYTYYVPAVMDENGQIVWRGDSETDSFREYDNALDDAKYRVRKMTEGQ